MWYLHFQGRLVSADDHREEMDGPPTLDYPGELSLMPCFWNEEVGQSGQSQAASTQKGVVGFSQIQ